MTYNVFSGTLNPTHFTSRCLGALLRQDNPCSPRACFPHAHVCGSQALQPNLWATASLIASSDSLSPTAVIGGACSQSAECEDAATVHAALLKPPVFTAALSCTLI